MGDSNVGEAANGSYPYFDREITVTYQEAFGKMRMRDATEAERELVAEVERLRKVLRRIGRLTNRDIAERPWDVKAIARRGQYA